MIDWVLALVPIVKGVHIVGLAIWCAGLIAMPLMLARHDPAINADDYGRIRRATHFTYTMCTTPAAVFTVIAGTWLIFMREVFTPWLYAKLVFVALLVVAHAWIGHILAEIAEEPGTSTPPEPYLPVAAVLVPVIAILVLVLGKPDLGWISFPGWLAEPRGGQLPFEVPNR